MNKREALQAILQNKKIRRISWPKDEYVEMDDQGNFLHSKKGNVNSTWSKWSLEGWEIYVKQKVKVKYFRPNIIRYDDGFIEKSPCKEFCEDKKEFKCNGFKIISWEQIEVLE